MGITEWVAVLVIFAVVYCLIKRYETRLVLIGSGLLLCLISWNLVGGLNAFAKSMTNASLVMAICGSMGFAFVAKYTEADRSLVHYLSAPLLRCLPVRSAHTSRRVRPTIRTWPTWRTLT